jgi:Protein of unknown function (DUF1302)
MSHRYLGWSAIVAIAVATLGSSLPAHALQKLGPIQISGNVQSQNLIRHPDIEDFEYIQNRNVAHIQLQYDWLNAGKFYGKFDIPFIESSQLFLIWRGSYDSIYDTTPHFIEKEDIHGKSYPGRNGLTDVYTFAREIGVPRSSFTLAGLRRGERNAYKFENQLREAYIDLKMRSLPLTIRAGKQQIVWGESDNFRLLDRANSLDLTWHLVQEIPAPAFGWDEIRRPFWMIKFLYDVGDVWKFSQNFLEWYWNPGDWYPAKQAFLPRPWGLRILNPLTNPVDGGFTLGVCSTSPIKDANGFSACNRLMGNTKLFQQGDYSRNPFENSQVGVRYHSIAPFGLEFTLNYLYQRFSGDDGTDYAPIRAIESTGNPARDAVIARQFTEKGIFPAEFIAPYVHTIGASANYSDETYTQTVFRAETVYDVGLPFFDLGKVTVIDIPALPGVRKKNMWKGMIAFDRPTWIRPLNRKSTVFLTGQFFWHYVVNNPSCQAQSVAQLGPRQREKFGSCLVGGLDLPSRFRTSTLAFRDKIRDWETLFTLAGFTFYRGGSVVPVAGIAVDPVNHFGMEPFWMVDYLVTADIAVNLAQRYFVTPQGHSKPIFDSWGLSSLSQGRSETSVRITYQF